MQWYATSSALQLWGFKQPIHRLPKLKSTHLSVAHGIAGVAVAGLALRVVGGDFADGAVIVVMPAPIQEAFFLVVQLGLDVAADAPVSRNGEIDSCERETGVGEFETAQVDGWCQYCKVGQVVHDA